LLGLIGVAWCAGFWLLFRDRPEQVARLNAAERELIARARDTGPSHTENGRLSALFTSLNVWALCAMYGCVRFAGNFTTNLLPVYLAEDRHLPPATVKTLTSLPLVFGVVSCIAGGLLSDWMVRRWHSRKWGRRINGCLGLGLAGLTILAVPFVQPVWLLALLFSASFFFNDMNIAPAWAACADVGERYAGTISGAMNMIGQFGGVVGMSLAGWLLHRGHVTLLFVLFACSYGLAAACWLAVDVTRRLRLPHADQSVNRDNHVA
jgi:nitrate/nitrite transporter NarK